MDTAQNQDVLGYLRSFAMPSVKGRGLDYAGWELHTHPDLVQHFEKIAGSAKALVPLLGVPVVVHKEIIVAVAVGTDHLLFRLPRAPVGVEREEPIAELHGTDWYAVSAWQSAPDGLQRLKDLLRDARDYRGR